ncbi:MAG: hypothetical protein MUF54_07920 [Polyangiaceae bacterium]|nr:hypothetical protein [Polyangiaceae bacterium]
MIHVIGDSHCIYAFQGIPGAESHHLGALTMHRLGLPEDNTLRDEVAKINAGSEDVLLFTAGEIDVRCHVFPQAEKLDGDYMTVIEKLASAFVDKLVTLRPSGGAQMGVVSVSPPTTRERAHSAPYPVAGSDAQRAYYTRRLNAELMHLCEWVGMDYLDLYLHYADSNGMLRPECSDGNVHIADSAGVRRILADAWLMEDA